MQYALPLLVSLLLTLQKVTQKRYNTLCPSGTLLFCGMISLCAMGMFWGITAATGAWEWHSSFLLPALGFGLFYAMGTLFTVQAIKNGSLARTTLVTSYSLLVPAATGVLLLHEPVKGTMVAGVCLLVLSLWLTHHRKNVTEDRLTLKWAICAALGFAGSGLCSAVQKLAPHSVRVPLNQSLYMTVALGVSAVTLSAVSFTAREPLRGDTLRIGAPLALVCGLCNGGVNLLVLYLNARIPASVMFPTVSAGQIILVCLYAHLICRERYTKKQWAGFAVGILSVIFLNL